MRRDVVSLLSLLVLLLAACGGAEDDVEGEADPEVEAEDTEASEDAPGDDEAGDDADASGSGDADTEPSSEPAPEPDPARVEEPCAEHDGESTGPFIDVASPVDDQHVESEVDLVGCASVYEGTVHYRLVAEDGEELLDDVTTAECGGPCVGEFVTTIDLAAAQGHDAATLAVFWDSPAGDGEQDTTEIELVLD